MDKFLDIFEQFFTRRVQIKTLFVASSDKDGNSNCAPKLLVDVQMPNKIYFLDYSGSRTYTYLAANPKISVAIMDDPRFTGFRMNGTARVIKSGAAYEAAKKEWSERALRFESERIIERVKGLFSAREAELSIPQNFVIVELSAIEGAVVKPGRILRALKGDSHK